VSNPAGDAATIVKLFRVAMLLPVVLVISFALQRRRAETAGSLQAEAPPLLPAFLLAFALLVSANSLGWLPEALTSTLREASRWCLVVAIAALGIRTSLGELASVGWRPVAIIVGETVFVGVFVLAGLSLS
jgi:uncharacterized membrane protein YadS